MTDAAFRSNESSIATGENRDGRYIGYTGYIGIPVLHLTPLVLPKEEMSLDPLQQFLMEAIEMGNSAEDIAKATNLTLSTIEKELLHLEKQDLVEKRGEEYVVGEVSRRLLLVKQCAKLINTEGCSIVINRIDKSIMSLEMNPTSEEKTDIMLRPKYDADDISLEDEDVKQFFIQWLQTKSNISDDDINDIVDALYIDEWKVKRDCSYIVKQVKWLPCYSRTKSELQEQEILRAKGSFFVLSYTFNSNVYKVYYDTVSGMHNYEILADAGLSKYYSMQLPKLHTLSDEEELNLIDELKIYYSLGESVAEKKETYEMEYYVDFQLSDLLGEEA